MRKIIAILVVLAVLLCIAAAAIPLYYRFRPQPTGVNRALFQGIQYERRVSGSPRPVVVHILTIDLQAPGIEFLVTPGDANAELPLQARTTSQFLGEFNLQAAINGDGFTPWNAATPLNFYPHSGDRVAPTGYAASQGEVYSFDTDNEPTLYISRTKRASFRTPTGRIHNAISGSMMLVEGGQTAPQPAPDGEDQPEPRSAVGVSRNGRWMYLVVVDGRMPGYSEGVTLQELAALLRDLGAHNAMNLDGGGSSTLAVESIGGIPRVLNTPIHTGIAGRERPVGNHLGIYASPTE